MLYPFTARKHIGLIPDGSSLDAPNINVKLAMYKYIQEQVNAHDGDYIQSDVALYAQRMISDSLITATSMHALTTDPDPTYQPTIAAGPLAFQLFGENVVVEASDFS